MTRTTKKLAALLLAAAMMITMMPALGMQTAYAASFPDKISVGYRDSDDNYHNVTLDSTKPGYFNGNPEAQELTAGMEPLDFNAYYDVEKHALMLKNYQGGAIDERTGSGDLTIVLFGNNTISSRGNNAINVPGSVEITSQHHGKLTIINQPDGMDSFGIRADKNITLSGSCVLDITSNTLTTNDNDSAFGINTSHGDIVIKDQADVTINCSTKSENENGSIWGIYAHTGNIDISTTKPIDITINAAGSRSSACGIQTAGGSTVVNISNIPYITMDVTGYEAYLRGLLPTRAVEALSDANYHVVSEQNGRHLSYTIEPKPYAPDVIDVEFDTSELLPLTTEMTGKGVNEKFFAGIQSPVGETCPDDASDGWFIRKGDITGFCDDDYDWHELENSTEPLVEGDAYFFRFEVALDNTNYRWNPEQDFTINGSDAIIISDGQDSDGHDIYVVGLTAIVPTDMSAAEITLDETSYTYDGTPKTPAATVVFDGTMQEGRDYTLSYENNVNAGTATVKATGIGIFRGEAAATFEIKPAAAAVPSGKSLVYSGEAQTGVEESEAYTATGNTETNVGTYTATLSLKDKTNFIWEDGTTEDKTVKWSISKADNPLKMSAKTATVKYSKLKKKTQTLAVTKVIKFTKDAKDKKNYTLSSAKKGKKSFKKYFKINKTTGKVTVKKGLKKGTYKVKVKVKALGNSNYNQSGLKTVTFTVKVK